jgi:hypothetical protein
VKEELKVLGRDRLRMGRRLGTAHRGTDTDVPLMRAFDTVTSASPSDVDTRVL